MNEIFLIYISFPVIVIFSSNSFTQSFSPCHNKITGSCRPTNYFIINGATLIHSLDTATMIVYLIRIINQPGIIKPGNFL